MFGLFHTPLKGSVGWLRNSEDPSKTFKDHPNQNHGRIAKHFSPSPTACHVDPAGFLVQICANHALPGRVQICANHALPVAARAPEVPQSGMELRLQQHFLAPLQLHLPFSPNEMVETQKHGRVRGKPCEYMYVWMEGCIYLCIHLFMCLFIYSFTYLFIYLYIH